MKVDKIVVEGREYVPADSVNKEISGDAKIVILQRGWIMVGRLERKGSDCILHNASVIRSWGTKKGLGEIAKNGPTKETVLDKCYGDVQFDYITMVASISILEEKWKKEL